VDISLDYVAGIVVTGVITKRDYEITNPVMESHKKKFGFSLKNISE